MANTTLYKTTGHNIYDETRDLYWRIDNISFKEPDSTKAIVELWAHLSPEIAIACGCRVMKTVLEITGVNLKTQDYISNITTVISNLDPDAEEPSPLLNATEYEIE